MWYFHVEIEQAFDKTLSDTHGQCVCVCVCVCVCTAIVTCGGLCPGLNNVVKSITDTLLSAYGAKKVWGVQFGYKVREKERDGGQRRGGGDGGEKEGGREGLGCEVWL